MRSLTPNLVLIILLACGQAAAAELTRRVGAHQEVYPGLEI